MLLIVPMHYSRLMSNNKHLLNLAFLLRHGGDSEMSRNITMGRLVQRKKWYVDVIYTNENFRHTIYLFRVS